MTSVSLSFGAHTSVAMPLTPPASARFPYQVGREARAVDHSSLRRARECSMSTTDIGMRGPPLPSNRRYAAFAFARQASRLRSASETGKDSGRSVIVARMKCPVSMS